RNALEKCIRAASREAPVAVLCLDLDDFKGVNDTLGHPVGDLLLVAVAERLRQCGGTADTIARLSGDEFAIVQVGQDQPAGAAELARKIMSELNRPFEIEGHHVVMGA